MTVDKEKYRQKKVAAYCRVSTDSEEQLVSYANQKKVYTEMIASRKDWCFAGLFADEGKSGTRADKRPEFNKMINRLSGWKGRLHHHQIRIPLCEKYGRLPRLCPNAQVQRHRRLF